MKTRGESDTQTGDERSTLARGGHATRVARVGDSVVARMPRVVLTVVAKARNDRINGVAAEVAFFGILAVFPGLLMLAAALGVLEFFIGSDLAEVTRRNVIQFLRFILTERARPAVTAVSNLFEAERGGVLTLASVAALWSLSRGFHAIVVALNVAYDVAETRSWLRRRLMELGLALGSVVLSAVSLTGFVAGPFFGKARALTGGWDMLRDVWLWARWPLISIALVAWATTLFRIAPDRHMPWRRHLPGGVVSALLWLGCSGGFTLYLRLAAAANPVIGALGGGLILLIWLYLLSMGLLVGGEVNASWAGAPRPSAQAR